MNEKRTDSMAWPVYSVAGVRALDRAAIEKEGIPGYELMHRAASFALSVARVEYPAARRWLLLCGSGNNGGDAFVLARLAMAEGIDVSALWLANPDRLDGDAATACRDFQAAGGKLEPFSGALEPDAELLIDGMLGSGLTRDVAGNYASAVDAVGKHAAPVIALDIPTGLHGDTGAPMGAVVRADVTVTFVGRKAGLYQGSGPDCVGRHYFSDLDIPSNCFTAATPVLYILRESQLRGALPQRPRQSHKGHFGHVIVVGGAAGMPGAVRLAGEAALRAGAGRVSLATHPAHAHVIPAGCPELMCHAVRSAADLDALLGDASVVAIGPGLGTGDWSTALFSAVRDCGKPLVFDADALTLLAAAPDRRDDRILTPHPGEAARLLGSTAAAVQADRLAALHELQARFGGTIVLKGCGTLVAGVNGARWLSLAGNPGMSTAGMGDVLTGVVAALRAQGLDPDLAAAVGVEVHGRAADVAATGGERGMRASDLLAELRPWMNP